MAARTIPTVPQRALANALERRREAAGLSREDVSSSLEWSSMKLWRIETARVTVSPDSAAGSTARSRGVPGSAELPTSPQENLILRAMKHAADREGAILPPVLQGNVTIQDARFRDAGSGRLIVTLDGQVHMTDEQLATLSKQLKNRLTEARAGCPAMMIDPDCRFDRVRRGPGRPSGARGAGRGRRRVRRRGARLLPRVAARGEPRRAAAHDGRGAHRRAPRSCAGGRRTTR